MDHERATARYSRTADRGHVWSIRRLAVYDICGTNGPIAMLKGRFAYFALVPRTIRMQWKGEQGVRLKR